MVTHTVKDQSDEIRRLLGSGIDSIREDGARRLDALVELDQRVRALAGGLTNCSPMDALLVALGEAKATGEVEARRAATQDLWVAMGEESDLDEEDFAGLLRRVDEMRGRISMATRTLEEVTSAVRAHVAALSSDSPAAALASLARLVTLTHRLNARRAP